MPYTVPRVSTHNVEEILAVAYFQTYIAGLTGRSC
jgi:hypothetical protein